MLVDANALVREVDCLLKEVESLVERLGHGFEDARKKVEALEAMRRGFSAFGNSEVVAVLSTQMEPLRERVQRIDRKLRASLGDALIGDPSPRDPSLRDPSLRDNVPAGTKMAPSSTAPPTPLAPGAPRGNAANGSTAVNGSTHGAAHAEPSLAPARATSPPDASTISALASASGSPAAPCHAHDGAAGIVGHVVLPKAYASKSSAPSPIVPPDPEDLEKIHALEEECDREFARLHFASYEERHAVLTLAAGKARRLRTRMHESYAVDRRLGDLIRRIVELKRRYRLGWIDGCERSFDVPDWDAYVDRCGEHLREQRMRETLKHEEGRIARERAAQLATEVDRRGRELRGYLDTDEGRLGTEPEKLRAALMSYLAVDGMLDGDLIERLRAHRTLFTGIAFRRVRKAFEKAPSGRPGDDELPPDVARARERVQARLRGQRAVLLGGAVQEETRARLEPLLGVTRLVWVDVSYSDAMQAIPELAAQAARGEVQLVLRTGAALHDPHLRDAIARASAPIADLERLDDAESVITAVDRALGEPATHGA